MMKTLDLNKEAIINAYNNGQSLNAIANTYDTYAISIRRLLEKEGVPLRHDAKTSGSCYVKDGEKLIEWAKTQGRLVTKAELAQIIGTKKLSPSYFEKYPELSKYIVTYERDEFQDYIQKLYEWLQKMKIPYKPNDRTKIQMSLTALLLGEYDGLALQLDIKPTNMSKKQYEKNIKEKIERGTAAGIHILFLQKEHFENLDGVIELLDSMKYSKRGSNR